MITSSFVATSPDLNSVVPSARFAVSVPCAGLENVMTKVSGLGLGGFVPPVLPD